MGKYGGCSHTPKQIGCTDTGRVAFFHPKTCDMEEEVTTLLSLVSSLPDVRGPYMCFPSSILFKVGEQH